MRGLDANLSYRNKFISSEALKAENNFFQPKKMENINIYKNQRGKKPKRVESFKENSLYNLEGFVTPKISSKGTWLSQTEISLNKHNSKTSYPDSKDKENKYDISSNLKSAFSNTQASHWKSYFKNNVIFSIT